MKILMLAILLTASEIAIISQTYYPQYGSNNQTNPVTYYPTYAATAPTPQTKKPSLAMAIVWCNSLVIELTVNATPGERYGLESSADLKTWVEIEKVFIGVSGQRVVRIPFDPSTPQKFFRLNK